ncbi:MAG: type I-E CRISPR-associated protein Cse1/CasA [Parvimonas sp.]|nr:type I-E CRISPR-associated protein Cse1/CasA [Parvimonas sp.]
MSSFNLLDEKWLKVVAKNTNEVIDVSLIELFENAQDFKILAGEMKTQDFSVLRLLLAVLHTVYSRFNVDGKVYDYLEVDEMYRQKEDVSEDDLEDYKEELMDTWKNLWKNGQFSQIVLDYLEKWREHFYIFDEKYPFYQVTKEEIYSNIDEGKTPTKIAIKNINRLISESENKIALFSPKSDINANKNNVTDEEFARWLIMFQGYTGNFDKRKIKNKSYSSSNGWLYDIGGVYFEGDNLFETLLLNLALAHPSLDYVTLSKEKPCWEFSGTENIQDSFNDITNLSGLYTNWSRAIYLDKSLSNEKNIDLHIVKMPNIEHTNNFLELMTIWNYNKKGKNTPKKHTFGQSLWRSFGMLSIHHNENVPDVGIVTCYEKISNFVERNKIIFKSVSMEDDGNPTSRVPTNEIVDELKIDNMLLFDDKDDGWVIRVNDIIEETKQVIEIEYKSFLEEIKEIRNYSKKSKFIPNEIEILYSKIDNPFKNWLFNIDKMSKKDDKIFEWRKTFKNIIVQSAQEILNQSNPRDLKGIKKDDKIKNVPMIYNTFEVNINKILG